MKIVLCGPPHSGKSCLRYGLKEAIKALVSLPYPYVITACPDGEGSWYQETAGEHLDLAQTLKMANKKAFTKAQATIMGEWVKNCENPLVLVDIGGIPDDKNEIICAHATHAIMISGDLRRLAEWRDFCAKLGLVIIAEIYSDYCGVEDKSLQLCADGVYRGTVHYLERGDMSVQYRPAVMELAEILLRRAEEETNERL